MSRILITAASAFLSLMGSISAPSGNALPAPELAAPQPDIPICSRCNLPKKDPDDEDDAISMTLEVAYKGTIEDAYVTAYSRAGATETFFSDSVLDSLNDRAITTTQAPVDADGATSVWITFVLADGSAHSEAVEME